MKIRVTRNQTEFGPYDIADINGYLKLGSLLATDLAWHEGLSGWIPLCQIPGVRVPVKAKAPLPPQTTRPGGSAHPNRYNLAPVPQSPPTKRPRRASLVGAVVLVVGSLLAFAFWPQIRQNVSANTKARLEPRTAAASERPSSPPSAKIRGTEPHSEANAESIIPQGRQLQAEVEKGSADMKSANLFADVLTSKDIEFMCRNLRDTPAAALRDLAGLGKVLQKAIGYHCRFKGQYATLTSFSGNAKSCSISMIVIGHTYSGHWPWPLPSYRDTDDQNWLMFAVMLSAELAKASPLQIQDIKMLVSSGEGNGTGTMNVISMTDAMLIKANLDSGQISPSQAYDRIQSAFASFPIR